MWELEHRENTSKQPYIFNTLLFRNRPIIYGCYIIENPVRGLLVFINGSMYHLFLTYQWSALWENSFSFTYESQGTNLSKQDALALQSLLIPFTGIWFCRWRQTLGDGHGASSSVCLPHILCWDLLENGTFKRISSTEGRESSHLPLISRRWRFFTGYPKRTWIKASPLHYRIRQRHATTHKSKPLFPTGSLTPWRDPARLLWVLFPI